MFKRTDNHLETWQGNPAQNEFLICQRVRVQDLFNQRAIHRTLQDGLLQRDKHAASQGIGQHDRHHLRAVLEQPAEELVANVMAELGILVFRSQAEGEVGLTPGASSPLTGKTTLWPAISVG